MSSARRSGNEESILAKLERDSGPGLGRQFGLTARVAAYAAGGALVLGLVGMLVWLARDNASQPTDVMIAHAVDAAPPHQAPAAGASQQPAAIVDEAPSAAHAAGHADLPPLVLLPNAHAGNAQPREHASPQQPVLAGTQTSPAKGGAQVVQETAPPEPPPAAAMRAPVVAPPAKHAASVAAADIEPKHGAKMPHAEPARARPPRTAAAGARTLAQQTAAKAAKQPKKTAAPAQPREQVDSDVALISAVIMHANKSNMGHDDHDRDCGTDADCAAKATKQP
jgi:hypothetical protein